MILDFSFLPKYMSYFINGVKLTILISLIAVLIGVVLGSIIYFMKASKFEIFGVNPLKIIATVYVEIIRGTPMILQIMIAYVAFDKEIAAAIIAVSLNSAAYVSEIIRGGIDSVDKGQLEAARSLGMNKAKAMKLIIMPQAIKHILPAIGNEFVTVIKESSMASVIGVGELMYASNVVRGVTYKGFEPLIIAAAFYFVITFTLGRTLGYVERRMKVSDSH